MRSKARDLGAFFIREWLLSISAIGIVAASLYLQSWPAYRFSQIVPILLLFFLFVAVRGIERSGLLTSFAHYLEGGRWLAPKIVLLTFLLSIFLSIDVTLVTLLPLVLAMRIENRERLFLLVAFTAHAGAALTPFGTPQNLFIFSFYHLQILPFLRTIAPFSLGLSLLFLLVSFFIATPPRILEEGAVRKRVDLRQGVLFLGMLVLVVLAVLHLLPWYTGAIVPLFALFYDRKSLEVDYALLATFLLFLGLANQMKVILAPELSHPVHLFILSSVLSQAISNVPTTLLLHQFTANWQALLWGTNVGGFGTPVAALANLIAWRIYASDTSADHDDSFIWEMIFWGFVVYAIGVVFYFTTLF